MVDFEALHAKRMTCWRQTPETRVPDADAAAQLIERVGIATLYPASPEIPNLYHSYVGNPDAPTDSEWDSPSGHVYSWRWELGRREAAFYSAIVRNRPTWISWRVLPAVLRVRGELRTPDELVDLGAISPQAYRVAQVLEASGGVLSTEDLRKEAGFPMGKQHRAAYLKAVEELDTRMLLAKVFSADDEEMRHALVSVRFPRQTEEADAMSWDDAMETVLTVYLAQAQYARSIQLARHLKLQESTLRAGLDRLVESGTAARVQVDGEKALRYLWAQNSSVVR